MSVHKVGQDVPSFSVTTLESKEVSTAVLKGKVVLLNFWATWCPRARPNAQAGKGDLEEIPGT